MCIRGMVFADGKENLLDAFYRPRRNHGHCSTALVEPGAYAAFADWVLVDCV